MLVIRQETPSYDDDDHPENVKEGSFCHKNLSSDDVRSIFSLFRKLETLNLSNNFIDSLPKGLPRNLKALNLSYNSFAKISGFENVENLIEVNLRNNRLQSTWGLGVAVSLEYLDVSFNSILAIEGLEGLMKLQVLKAANNNLKTLSSIRSLSLNKNLTTVDLSQNPVTQLSKYRGYMFNFILSLQVLDNISTSRRPNHRTTNGYTSIFEQQRSTQLTKNPSSDNQLATILPSQSPERFRIEPVSSPNKSMEAMSFHIINEMAESGYDLTLQEPESPLPWRCPPDIIPRPWKGNDPYNYATSSTTKMLRPKKKKSTEKKVLSKGWNRMLYKVTEEAREADYRDSLLKRPLKAGSGSMRRQDSALTLATSLTTASRSTRGGGGSSSNHRQKEKGRRVPPSPKSISGGSPKKSDRLGSQSPNTRSRRSSTSYYRSDNPPSDGDSKHKYKITLGRRDAIPTTPDTLLDTPFSLPPQQLYISSETSYSFPKRRAPPGHINPVPVSKHLPKQDFYEQDLSMSRQQYLNTSSALDEDDEYSNSNRVNDSLSYSGKPTISTISKVNKGRSSTPSAGWMTSLQGPSLPPFPLEKALDHISMSELRVDPPIELLDMDYTPLSTAYRPMAKRTSFKSSQDSSYDYRQEQPSVSSSIDQYPSSTNSYHNSSPIANRGNNTIENNPLASNSRSNKNKSKLNTPKNYKGVGNQQASQLQAAPPPLPALISSPSSFLEQDDNDTEESIGGQISPERMKLIVALVERKKETMRILKENKTNYDNGGSQFDTSTGVDERNYLQNFIHSPNADEYDA